MSTQPAGRSPTRKLLSTLAGILLGLLFLFACYPQAILGPLFDHFGRAARSKPEPQPQPILVPPPDWKEMPEPTPPGGIVIDSNGRAHETAPQK
jgi:hypothetical protein